MFITYKGELQLEELADNLCSIVRQKVFGDSIAIAQLYRNIDAVCKAVIVEVDRLSITSFDDHHDQYKLVTV